MINSNSASKLNYHSPPDNINHQYQPSYLPLMKRQLNNANPQCNQSFSYPKIPCIQIRMPNQPQPQQQQNAQRNISPPMNRMRPNNSYLMQNDNVMAFRGNAMLLNRKIQMLEQKMMQLEKRSMQMERMNGIARRMFPNSFNYSNTRNNNNRNNYPSSFSRPNNPRRRAVLQRGNEGEGLNNEIVNLRNELIRRFDRMDKKQMLQLDGIQYVIRNVNHLYANKLNGSNVNSNNVMRSLL